MFTGYLQRLVMKKGPMAWMVLGACIKQIIEDKITCNPNGIISNTYEIMEYMPDLSKCVYQHIMKMMSFPTESYFETWMI